MSKRHRNINRSKAFPVENFQREDRDLPYTNDPLSQSTPTGNWIADKSTTATSVDDDNEDEDKYHAPETWPSFATNVLQGQISVKPNTIFLSITIVWFGVTSWLLIQDNDAGLLQTPDGWKMFGFKASATSAIYIVTSVILLIYSIVLNIKRKKKRNT